MLVPVFVHRGRATAKSFDTPGHEYCLQVLGFAERCSVAATASL
ncbi:hypothetical protein HEP87_64245 [Streptomyces sp. S1D4-11]|nr:hypothetical protein [Streptomyces sp. S1D4-11]